MIKYSRFAECAFLLAHLASSLNLTLHLRREIAVARANGAVKKAILYGTARA